MPTIRTIPLALLGVVAVLAAGCGSDDSKDGASTSQAQDSFAVAASLIAPVDFVEANVAEFEKALRTQIEAAGKTVTFKDYNAQGQVSNVATINNQIANSDVDLVYAIGTPLVVGYMQKDPQTPMLFAAMSDPVGSRVARSLEAPGGNATGTSDAVPAGTTLDLVQQVLPDAKRIGTVINTSEANSTSQVDALKAEAESRGLEVEVKPVVGTGDVASAIRALDDVDALVIVADNTVISAVATVSQTARELKLPTFTSTGPTNAARGILVAYGVDYSELGRLAARQAASILLDGKDPGAIPVIGLDAGATLQVGVNAATARAIGVELPADLTETAKVFDR
jgi:putative ABC transport system substrate-binding protein